MRSDAHPDGVILKPLVEVNGHLTVKKGERPL
jgi:hypothetical protein